MLFSRSFKFACRSCLEQGEARSCIHFDRIKEGQVSAIQELRNSVTIGVSKISYAELDEFMNPRCPTTGGFSFQCLKSCCSVICTVYLNFDTLVLKSYADQPIRPSYVLNVWREKIVPGEYEYDQNESDKDSILDTISNPESDTMTIISQRPRQVDPDYYIRRFWEILDANETPIAEEDEAWEYVEESMRLDGFFELE